MGIVLAPIFLIALIAWVLASYFFILGIVDKRIASYWSILLAFCISIATYILVVLSWSGKSEINALTPLFILPFTHIIIPAMFGIAGSYIPKEKKIGNIIGYAICISAILSPILLIMVEGSTQANTFINIKLTH
ncbi:MAG: hypothetical protein ACI9N1_002509 [Flavobacteriales bacterium]|jgi:hypothetical protein